MADITCLQGNVFLRTMRYFDDSPLSYSQNMKCRFLRSKKPMFTRSTVNDPPAIYILETRAVAMIGFGYKRVWKKCMVR